MALCHTPTTQSSPSRTGRIDHPVTPQGTDLVVRTTDAGIGTVGAEPDDLHHAGVELEDVPTTVLGVLAHKTLTGRNRQARENVHFHFPL